jgi:5-methylcytosine-specific restriction enzyme subunit McrC
LRSTSVEHESGGIAVNGFLLDMPRLFEAFVTTALREALMAGFDGRVDGQDRHYLDQAAKVVLRPDIVWKVRGSPVAVIDAKYKAEKPAGYPNADLYQLLAYCTVLGLREGHLVYAKGNEEPAHHVVRQSGINIFCHAIDLNQPPEVLLRQMCRLAEAIASSSGRLAAALVRNASPGGGNEPMSLGLHRVSSRSCMTPVQMGPDQVGPETRLWAIYLTGGTPMAFRLYR